MATPVWRETEKRWRLDVYVEGKRRNFSSRVPGKKGLMIVNKSYNDALLSSSTKADWRLDRCWETYLEEVEALTSFSNYDQREQYGRLYVLPRLGYKKIGTITEQDWQDCITKAKPVRTNRTTILSKKSLANLRSAITDFHRFAYRSRMVQKAEIALRLPKNAPKIEKGILLPDQLQTLFEPSGEWYINAWRLMVVTGFRPGEVYGLRNTDIQDGVLSVRRSINAHLEVTAGKNQNARRGILVHPIAMQVLVHQQEKLTQAGVKSDWLFPDRDGSIPNPQNAYHQWTHYRKRHGIAIPPYGFRHTFISLTRNRLPESMLKRLVGHSESMDTQGVYGHYVTGDMEEESSLVNSALAKWIGSDSGSDSIGNQLLRISDRLLETP